MEEFGRLNSDHIFFPAERRPLQEIDFFTPQASGHCEEKDDIALWIEWLQGFIGGFDKFVQVKATAIFHALTRLEIDSVERLYRGNRELKTT